MLIPGDLQFGKHRFCLAELAFAPIDDNHIRDLTFFDGFTVATAQHLVHRSIIITRRDARDVIAAIFSPHRAVGIEYHAGGHGLLPHRVADIETLHPLHFRHFQHGCQRIQTLMDG
ncbi:hypothetical protein D3C75_1121910 [compost metagenome]